MSYSIELWTIQHVFLNCGITSNHSALHKIVNVYSLKYITEFVCNISYESAFLIAFIESLYEIKLK